MQAPAAVQKWVLGAQSKQATATKYPFFAIKHLFKATKGGGISSKNRACTIFQ